MFLHRSRKEEFGEPAAFPSEGKAWKRDDLVKHVLKSCLGAGRGCQTLLFPPGEGGAGIMGTPRGGSREGGFAPRRCEPPATQHGSGEKPPRRGRPLAAFPRRRLLALKKPRGAKILRVEAVGGNGRAAAGSGREAFWETRGGGGRRGGEAGCGHPVGFLLPEFGGWTSLAQRENIFVFCCKSKKIRLLTRSGNPEPIPETDFWELLSSPR